MPPDLAQGMHVASDVALHGCIKVPAWHVVLEHFLHSVGPARKLSFEHENSHTDLLMKLPLIAGQALHKHRS